MKDVAERLGIHILGFEVNHGQYNCEIEICFCDPKTRMTFNHKTLGSHGEPLEVSFKRMESEIRYNLEKVRGAP